MRQARITAANALTALGFPMKQRSLAVAHHQSTHYRVKMKGLAHGPAATDATGTAEGNKIKGTRIGSRAH